MADHVFAAFVGLDWGDQQHAVCLAAGGQRIATDLAHQADDIDAWAAGLRSRFGGRPIAVCLEQSRGALVYALLKYEFLVLFPINPKQLASYRDAFVPCGPKDDPTDAELLCMFVELHHARLRVWRPDDERSRVADDQSEDSRITLIRSSSALVTDQAVIVTHRLDVLHTVQLIIQHTETVDEYDRVIASHMAQHCDAALFQSFPAAGPGLAPRLAAAFGTDRERFSSAQEVQQFSGVAPVLKRSGKTCSVLRRLARPKFLHQTFHEYADHSRKKSAWAAAYYRMLKARGMGHHCALRSLAFKWQRVMYRCWKTRTLYDEARHLQQLRRRNSPLLAYLQPINDT